MLEPETKPEPEPKPKLTRAELRELLTCPVCKVRGGLSLRDDKCENCGSFQNESGEWVTPKPKREEKKPDKKERAWHEW